MTEPIHSPRDLVLAGAVLFGMLLTIVAHMLGARYGLDLGGLFGHEEAMPLGTAIAWWLTAAAGFFGGFFTAALLHGVVSGQIPRRLRHCLAVVGFVVLAGAGQAASAPSPIPTMTGVLIGIIALCLGAAMAFCGARLALSGT